MELAVLNTQGKETGRKVVLSDAVFGVEANDHAIYLDVKQYLADQRQGTHKSKQRNEVAGSTRKLKRQKGTGGARAGSIKSPLPGRRTHLRPPAPRLQLQAQQEAQAAGPPQRTDLQGTGRRHQRSGAHLDGGPQDQGRRCPGRCAESSRQKVLLVLPESNANLQLSCRNLPYVQPVLAQNVCTYDVMNASAIVMVEGAENVLNTMLA